MRDGRRSVGCRGRIAPAPVAVLRAAQVTPTMTGNDDNRRWSECRSHPFGLWRTIAESSVLSLAARSSQVVVVNSRGKTNIHSTLPPSRVPLPSILPLSPSLSLNLPRLFRSVARMKEAYLSDKVSPPSRSLLRSNYGIDLAVAPSLPLLCPAAGRRGVRGVVHATGTKNREREERHNEKSRCTAPPATAARMMSRLMFQSCFFLDTPI